MKDILADIISHTHALGFLEIVKVTGTKTDTLIESMAEDRSVVLQAKTHDPVPEFVGTFGMPNLNKLDTLLKIPEYKEEAKLNLNQQERNGEVVPVGIHFENKAGDFQNDYRFMNAEIIENKLKSVKFKGVEWSIIFEPSTPSIMRFGYQAQVNSDEDVFTVKTSKKNLIFEFGDHSTHAGQFVFETSVGGTLKTGWTWPVQQVLKVLHLTGDKVMSFSDKGALQVTIDSGLARYNYILPAQSK
tara:strand:- start:525 stop:1256 length:732 start_codon:yes stop_codon:yes gene_type:complete